MKHLLQVFLTWFMITMSGVQVCSAQWASLSGGNKTIKIGESLTLKAEYGDGVSGFYWYYEGDPSIISFVASGNTATVTGKGTGTTQVAARFWKWSGSTKEYDELWSNITVIADPPTSISLNKTSLNLLVSGSEGLKATILPSTAVQEVNWTVLDEGFNVASVDSWGWVTAKAPGTATVRATAAKKQLDI